MEAALATLAVVAIMVIALAAVARTWPRTSQRGGYRAREAGDQRDRRPPRGGEGQSDDDDRWNWTRRE